MVGVIGDEGNVEEDNAGVDGEVNALPFGKRRFIGARGRGERKNEGNGSGVDNEAAAGLGGGGRGVKGGAGEERKGSGKLEGGVPRVDGGGVEEDAVWICELEARHWSSSMKLRCALTSSIFFLSYPVSRAF